MTRFLIKPVFSAFLLAAFARAGEVSIDTIVTFSAPVEVPGKALPAGTYVFKLIDSSTQNNVIQVFDQNQRHLLTTFLAVPNSRLRTAEKSIILFEEEKLTDTPVAVRAVVYKGESYAREFVYPHASALAIARRTHQRVLQRRDEGSSQVTGVDESGRTVDMKDAIPPKPQR